MTQLISRPKVTVPLVGILGLLILAFTLDGQAKDASPQAGQSLRVVPIKASYIERERGNVFSLACTLINDGDSDVTVVTENLNFSNQGVDETTNSLRCIIMVDDIPTSTAQGNPIIPSLYKRAPVTLHPGEATLVHYVQDFSRRITGRKSMNPAHLKADTVTMSYKVVEKWGKRFNIWSGQQTAEPFKFDKILRQ